MGRRIASSPLHNRHEELPKTGRYRSRTSGRATDMKRCVWVEELEKEGGIPVMGESGKG